METDFARWPVRIFVIDKLTNGFKNNFELFVKFLFQLVQPLRQPGI